MATYNPERAQVRIGDRTFEMLRSPKIEPMLVAGRPLFMDDAWFRLLEKGMEFEIPLSALLPRLARSNRRIARASEKRYHVGKGARLALRAEWHREPKPVWMPELKTPYLKELK